MKSIELKKTKELINYLLEDFTEEDKRRALHLFETNKIAQEAGFEDNIELLFCFAERKELDMSTCLTQNKENLILFDGVSFFDDLKEYLRVFLAYKHPRALRDWYNSNIAPKSREQLSLISSNISFLNLMSQYQNIIDSRTERRAGFLDYITFDVYCFYCLQCLLSGEENLLLFVNQLSSRKFYHPKEYLALKVNPGGFG